MRHLLNGLLPTQPHHILEVVFAFDEVEFADELNEVVTAESLSILLTANVFINLVEKRLIVPNFTSSILAKDVKLHEFETFVLQFPCEFEFEIWMHA